MLMSFLLLFTLFVFAERLFDDSADNRAITPAVGFVLTVLVCARFAHASPARQDGALDVVHVFLYITCLLYIRAMLDFFFRDFIFLYG